MYFNDVILIRVANLCVSLHIICTFTYPPLCLCRVLNSKGVTNILDIIIAIRIGQSSIPTCACTILPFSVSVLPSLLTMP